MFLAGRHIRHDWRTWNDDQTQKTIRTLCGAKSRPSLSGIPGVTSQPFWVLSKAGEKKLGWCWQCSKEYAKTVGASPPPFAAVELHPLFQRAADFAYSVRKLELTAHSGI